MVRRLFPWIYGVWITVCAILFAVTGSLEDPSRPKGRILSIEAGQRALRITAARGRPELEVVHVAHARAGEGGLEARWVVLLDRAPHTGLREAVVVELRARDGTLLRMRRPVS